MNKLELLAPAGDLFRAKIAFDYGADAVYFGGKMFSLRSRANNFLDDDISKLISYAHHINKKAYLVTNTICHINLLKKIDKYLDFINLNKPDAFIVADPAIFLKIRNKFKNVDIHISTQQSITNSKAALFWQRNGAKRIICAREVSYKQLKKMIQNVNNKIEIESFIHGAMCIGYSGRCMLSSNFCLRDANNGGCAQCCRWIYELSNDNKIISSNFTISPKDLCLINKINKLKKINLHSIKIEGRMKSEFYLACCVSSYRKAIDSNKKHSKKNVLKVANREVSYGWFNNHVSKKQMLHNITNKTVNQSYALIVNKKIDDYVYEITSKNYFTKHSRFELISPNISKNIKLKIIEIKDQNNMSLDIVNQPMSKLFIKINKNISLKENDMFRIIN